MTNNKMTAIAAVAGAVLPENETSLSESRSLQQSQSKVWALDIHRGESPVNTIEGIRIEHTRIAGHRKLVDVREVMKKIALKKPCENS